MTMSKKLRVILTSIIYYPTFASEEDIYICMCACVHAFEEDIYVCVCAGVCACASVRASRILWFILVYIILCFTNFLVGISSMPFF